MERRGMAIFFVTASLFHGSTKAYSFQSNLETIWYGGKGDIFSLRQILCRDRIGAWQSYLDLGTMAPSQGHCEEGKGLEAYHQIPHAHLSQGASSFVSDLQ